MSDTAKSAASAFWAGASPDEAVQCYQTLLDAVDDGIYRTDGDGCLAAVNDAIVELTGRSRDELVGEPLTVLFDGDGTDVEAELERLQDGGVERVGPRTLPVRNADGRRIRCEVRANALQGDPCPPGTVGVVRDLSEGTTRDLERYETLFAESQDVNAILTADGEFEYLPPSIANVLGYDPADLVGEHVVDYVHPEDWERVEAEFRALLDDASRHPTTRFRFEHADGHWVVLESKWRNLLDDPAIDGVVAYTRDVTERAERERELAEYETIVETMKDGVYVVDDDDRFETVNETFADMLGYARETLLGEHVSLVADDETIEMAKEWERRARDGEPVDPVVEATIETASGERLPVEATFSVPDDVDDQSRRVAVVRDVSSRNERKRELERRERQFDAVFEDPNILVALLEPDGTVVDINGTAMEYTDATLSAVTGVPFWETPWWGDGEEIVDDVREWTERAADGEYVDFEAELTRPDGEPYFVEGSFRPVTDDDGEVTSVIVSDRDVTERRVHERRLAEKERRYRTLAEYFPNGLVTLFDHDLEYTLAAGQGFDRIPVDPGDLEGQSFRDVWGEDTAAELEPVFQAALEGREESVELEYAGREWTVHGVPIADERGEVFAGMTMAQDVTEQKERERHLDEAKAQLEAAAEAGAVGTFEWYIQEDRFVAGPALARKFGIAPEEAREGVPLDVLLSAIHEDDRDRVVEKIEAAVESCGEYEAEYRVRNADGELRWVVARGEVEGDGDGNAVRFPGALTDITERKRAEQRIEESERRYRTLVENFPEGSVGLFDENLEYTVVGGQLLDTLDIDPEERVGRDIRELHPGELVDEIEPYFEAALDGEANAFEVEFQGRSLRANTLPVRNADGVVDAGMLVVQDVTERRRAQQDLRESEAKFRMLAESLEEVVWMATPDAEEFVYVNPAFEDTWGIDRERLYDEPYAFLDAVHPDDRERVREGFEALPEEDYEDEYRIVVDGETKWLKGRGKRVQSEDGEMTRVVGIGDDVTEQKEREAELERALDLLEKTERIADVGGWEIDVQTRDVFWTDFLFDLLEYPGDEEPPLSEALDIYHEEDRAMVEDAIEESIAAAEPFDVEGRLRTGTGELRWVRVQGVPEVEDGDVVTIRGAFQDITEQKEREAALEESKNQLRALIDVLPVAVFVAEADGEIVEWNDAAEEIWGGEVAESGSVAEYEAYDGWWVDTGEPVDPDEWALARALEGEEVTDPEEIEIEGFDGERRTVLNQGMPVRNADGDVTRAVVTLVDITDQKRRERRLEELVDELERSNERLEQFAYAASHDLQEPLRMVSSYLQLVERRYADDLDEDGEEFIEFAVDGANRMRDMIEGLLTYSRVDTKGDAFEQVDLDDVLADVRADLSVRIEETDADVESEPLPTVDGDAGQLRQLFQNLLENAIEYSGDDPPRIDVAAERHGDEWRISVHDEGVGIDPSDTDRVFDVFQSLHATSEHSGTGIGLAICERIVERHGGDIWVESVPGTGSTFTFTLPAGGDDDE